MESHGLTPTVAPNGEARTYKKSLSHLTIFFSTSTPQRCESVGGKHKVGRPGLEPGTTGLKVRLTAYR